MTAPDHDVVVVGAGPVGLVLGIQLAQHGRSVLILEQWPAPYPLPRAVHFDHEVGRILQSCGVGDAVRAISEAAEVYEWRNGAGTTLLRFGRVGEAPSGWPFSSMFCQPELEAVLAERAASLPSLELRRGVRVRSISQDDDRALVGHAPVRFDRDGSLVDADDAPEETTARYVVGCDGANSTVRDLLEVGVDDRGFCFDWLIVDVVLDEPRVFDPLNLQVCDPARPTTAVSGGPGRRRWEFMRLPEERIEDLDDEARAWELLAPWDVHPGNARLERHAVYTFAARVARRWQVGRAFLAGDAAHQMPPFAGQGMCSGLRDAQNLAWKLDLVLDGRATPALLATYDEERRPNAAAAIDFSIELGTVICVPDPADAAARDAAMAATYDGGVNEAPPLPGIASGCIHAASPHAGELFPQGRIDGEPTDDRYGAGWRLVTLERETEVDDHSLPRGMTSALEWFATVGGTVIEVADRSPELAQWFRHHDVRWALQRPDFHLYATATDADGAAAALADLRRRLDPSTPDRPGDAP